MCQGALNHLSHDLLLDDQLPSIRGAMLQAAQLLRQPQRVDSEET